MKAINAAAKHSPYKKDSSKFRQTNKLFAKAKVNNEDGAALDLDFGSNRRSNTRFNQNADRVDSRHPSTE